MSEGKIYIYHHNDHDGIVAAGVLYNYIMETNDINNILEENIIFNMIDYDKDLNFDHINFAKGDEAWFLDYSFTSQTNLYAFKNLLSRRIHYKNVVWIDHHASSIKLCETVFSNYHIYGIRNKNLCGAALTYLYLYKNIKNSRINNYTDEYVSNRILHDLNAPVFIKIIDDYDCWKQKYKLTNDFHYGLLLSDPKDPYITKMLNPDQIDVSDIVSQGKAIRKYLDFDNREYHVNMYGFEFTLPEYLGGLKCYCINRKCNSMMFGDKINEYDAVISFYYTNGMWKYSIFTNKDYVNCELIARTYGGGGHLQAAGWVSDNLIFEL